MMILLNLPIVALSQGNRYGVFVGIGDYQDQVKLASSKNDATAMCKIFSSNCGNGNTKLILESSATRQNILDAMNSYLVKIKSGDTFLFYYSGHGTRFPDKFSLVIDEPTTKKDTAIVPFDSKKTTSGKKWKNLILDDEIFQIFTLYTEKGVKVIFISDSCFSGGLDKGNNLDGSDINPKIGLEKNVTLKQAIGLNEDELEKTQKPTTESHSENYNIKGLYLFISSSGINESSYSQNPESGTENSLFTHSLLSFYKKNKKIQIRNITNEIKNEVVKFAKENGVKQTPLVINTINQQNSDFPIF
jgi:hypothetical protein